MEGGRDVESGGLSYLTSPFIGSALRQQARLKGLERPKGHRHHAHAPLSPPHCLRPFLSPLIPPLRLPFLSPSSFSLPPLLILPLPSAYTPRLSLHHSHPPLLYLHFLSHFHPSSPSLLVPPFYSSLLHRLPSSSMPFAPCFSRPFFASLSISPLFLILVLPFPPLPPPPASASQQGATLRRK